MNPLQIINSAFSTEKVQTVLQAGAIETIIQQITGEAPKVSTVDGHTDITLTEGQKVFFREQLESMLNNTGPDSAVSVNGVEDVILPVALKRAVPALLIVLAVGFLLGRNL